MSTVPPNQSGQASVSETYKRARFWVATGLSVLIVVWVAVIAWVATQQLPSVSIQKPAPGTDLNLLLAPMVAAAAGIERLLESAFDYFETKMREVVAFLAGRVAWLDWAQDEVMRMRKALETAATQAHDLDPLTEAGQKGQEALAVLEKQVETAEQRLSDVVNFDGYKSYKRALSVVIGLWLGVLVATAGALRMFASLGITVEPHVDVILTGIIIGTGSNPVHSLIGILQQTKDTLDGAQGYLKAKATVTKSEQ